MPGVVVSDQLDLLHRYSADLLSPPGDGDLPCATPLSMDSAAPRGSSR